MENLNAKELINIHSMMDEIAMHYQKVGISIAFGLIKTELVDKAPNVRSGAPDDILRDEGYDKAINKILELLKKESNS